MDTRRERWLAALLGALGTAAGVVAVEFIPRMMALDLVVRFPNVTWFFIMVLTAGAAGGRIGHGLFLHGGRGGSSGPSVPLARARSCGPPESDIAKGPLAGRALLVGATIGFAIAGTSWSLTYFFPGVLSPFVFNETFRPFMRDALGESLLAGSVGGVLAALGIVKHLRSLSGTREPLG